jgi:hypothetical protein
LLFYRYLLLTRTNVALPRTVGFLYLH